MPHLPPYLQACGFWYADVAFTIFAPDLLLSFDILGTYLPGCQCANPFSVQCWELMSVLLYNTQSSSLIEGCFLLQF